jgi:hypothetical protein
MELVTHFKMLKPFNNNTQLEVAYKTLNLFQGVRGKKQLVMDQNHAGQCVGVYFRFSELTF